MHYFAYGTLLVEESMKRVAPSARKIGYMRLDDYELGFGECSEPGVAGCTLLPKTGAVTYGIQFELSDEDMSRLDSAAHVGHDQWVHFPIELTSSTGETVRSVTYVIPGDHRHWRPTDAYVAPILTGLTQCDFPQEYKQAMRALITAAQTA